MIPKAAVRSRARTVFQGSGALKPGAPEAPPVESGRTMPAMETSDPGLMQTMVPPSSSSGAPAVPARGPSVALPQATREPSGAQRAPSLAKGAAASAKEASGVMRAPSGLAKGPSAVMPAGGGGAVAQPAPHADGELAGMVLNGRYQVKERLGEGGFGTVYMGEQVQMGRPCALKVLHARMARDPQVVGRFRREAKAASVLRSAHTVQIYDFDQTPEGVLYLAMELLTGHSLHSQVLEGPIAYQRVAHILDGICDSLGEAHQNGIVHRDIKPENIFLEPRPGDDDFAKVLDFGIAKIVSGEGGLAGPQLTAAGQTLGTVEYMSPEQLTGQELDGRSDLYALGILSYEMLTGGLPFAVKTTAEMITAHLKTVPQPPSTLVPGIPPELDAIVLKLLQKKRDNRFKDTVELREALKGVPLPGQKVPVRAAPAPVAAAPVVPAAPVAAAAAPVASKAASESTLAIDRGPKKGGMSTGTVLAIVGLGVALLGALAAAWYFLSAKAGAAEPPAAARVLPSVPELSSFLTIDVAQLRSAGPADVVSQLVEAARPSLKEIGGDPSKLGQVAMAVDVSDSVEDTKRAAAIVLDMPVDATKLEPKLLVDRDAHKPHPFETETYKGVKFRRSGTLSYAQLPGDRVVIGEQLKVEKLIDEAMGVGESLVDAATISGMLKKVGADAGKPAAYGWMQVTDRARMELAKQAPGLQTVQEAAGVLTVGQSGADVKAIGRCKSPEDAKKAADATKSLLKEAAQDRTVALLGLKAFVDATQIAVDDATVVATLHLTRPQYADVVTRFGGMVIAAVQARDQELKEQEEMHKQLQAPPGGKKPKHPKKAKTP